MAESPQIDLTGAWLFVDDDTASAESYRDRLAEGEGGLKIVVLQPSVGRSSLLTGATPLGVLMDVELSGEPGEHGTGLGLAQDVRANQKSRKIAEYPIVRFANPAPVQANVGGDPASDDLFDDRIAKSEVGRGLVNVQRRLAGVSAVYDGLDALGKNPPDEAVAGLFNLDEEALSDWLHPSLVARIADGMVQSRHVAAGAFLRTFLMATGLLIDRKLLLARLGLNEDDADKHWPLIEAFARPFQYTGLAAPYFPRWWARGLEQAWYELEGVSEPLATVETTVRAERMSAALGSDLTPLLPHKLSPGERPWRWCALSLENQPPEYLAIDPKFAVRMTPRADIAPWMDPLSASIGAAVRNKEDRRLNRDDIERLVAELK